MRKMIRENMQILLSVLLLFAGFYHTVSKVWQILELPFFWWIRFAFLAAAAVLNFGFILWIQKT